jgi:hypothetical protein
VSRPKKKQVDTYESVKGWVVETSDGSLVGPFRTAQLAGRWLRWRCKHTEHGRVVSEQGPDLNGKIRPVLHATG